jgi:2-polyprenyl-6-methoxyphenol hydroxylase-like FAD-dependent oxidoreductase
MIGITANAAHIVAKWGDGIVHEQFQSIICVMDELTLYNSKGEHLLTQQMPGFSKDTGYMGKRSEILKVMCEHVESLGIKVYRGKRITEYFETESEAGIIYDGRRFSADCVLACDGVNSKARGFVIGDVGKPHPTGYATYRAWFDATTLKSDPKTQWIVEGERDKSVAFIGPDVHCIFGTSKACKEMTWVLTHVVRSLRWKL